MNARFLVWLIGVFVLGITAFIIGGMMAGHPPGQAIPILLIAPTLAALWTLGLHPWEKL